MSDQSVSPLFSAGAAYIGMYCKEPSASRILAYPIKFGRNRNTFSVFCSDSSIFSKVSVMACEMLEPRRARGDVRFPFGFFAIVLLTWRVQRQF